MFDAFNAQAKSLGDLLSDNQPAKVIVPRFQRGFSWEKKHVEAFWNDIRTFRKESTLKGGPDKYFLGPIVLRQPSKDVIYVLDGQQRLATATILLSVLRDLSQQIGIEDARIFASDIQAHFISKEDIGFGLELGELDNAYFVATVQSFPPIAKKPTLKSHRHIQKAREFLMSALKASVSGMSPSDELAELKAIRKIIRTELVMASIPVSSERDAFKIFETLNDRGLRLSPPDLLLNYLMGNSSNTEDDRTVIRELWNDMIEGMGRRDINRFIRHMWVSKYGDLKSRDLFTALKDQIDSDKITPVEFALSCSQECANYVDLLKADKEELGSAAAHIKTIVRDLGIEPALPVLMSAYAHLSAADLEKIAKWLLVFITKYSIIVRLDSSGMENTLFALARDLRVKAMDGATPKECLFLVKDRLAKNAPVDDLVTTSVQQLILEPEEAAYVLSRIAVHKQSATKELLLGESNIEHIFPKKPSPEWADVDVLEPYLWHIGNLTMLGERLNNTAAGRGWANKKVEYEKSSLAITKELAARYSQWGEKEILGRAKSLVPVVKEIWNFDNPSRV